MILDLTNVKRLSLNFIVIEIQTSFVEYSILKRKVALLEVKCPCIKYVIKKIKEKERFKQETLLSYHRRY